MSHYYFVGSGIAALAGAVFLIRDGGVSGKDIVIFEESHAFGGAFDAHGDAEHGYFMSGSRMFESMYQCTFDLLASIPSATNPNISVKEETDQANAKWPWHNKVRLVDRDGRVPDFHTMGFSERDRIQLVALIAEPEALLDGKRITDCFGEHFFETNFWFEWCTLFAFERWHSAIEFRRYLRRFVHHFSTIDTQDGIYRSLYNQYDSFAVPLKTWLTDRGVRFHFGVRVDDLGFASGSDAITVTGLVTSRGGVTERIPVRTGDLVFVTNGSMTADKRFGSMTEAPGIERYGASGAWRLWEKLAQARPQFGNPAAFNGVIAESSWISYTVTVRDPLFLDLMEAFSGQPAGMGGLITFKDSNWLITISIYHQPFFPDQPQGVAVWWGYGLFHDRPGNFVRKPMADCSGAEILEEVLGHLHFAQADQDTIIAASTCIPCTMPYITSQFMVRSGGDRPLVVPDGSTNLAFLGQFAEQPDDVVFTVEYSVRSAMTAVYGLLKLNKAPPPVYQGLHSPQVIVDAIRTLHR
ncbi:oleate hydratase [Sphingomonas ginsenosidivorax]|uniref:Oleate hydratase n=1 Tax=Sphingomonas ginsenosidivorax TaxID=862135 RepID=A0A5C6UKF3_9SPHN|nr:oleate hydratase [Sphingomonas ginsenosidivorax]TXC71978.1 oleate hydratase [Sphingomonas ginsenosidivorax]